MKITSEEVGAIVKCERCGSHILFDPNDKREKENVIFIPTGGGSELFLKCPACKQEFMTLGWVANVIGTYLNPRPSFEERMNARNKNEVLLGFAVCGYDSGQGSVGIPTYQNEKLHRLPSEAETEFEALDKRLQDHYRVCRVIEEDVPSSSQPPQRRKVAKPFKRS